MSHQDVVFKGTKDGLHLILNGAQDFDVLKSKLKERLHKAEFFFHGADVVLDTGDAVFSIEQILEIQDILARPCALRLKKVVHSQKKPSDTAKRKREIRRKDEEFRLKAEPGRRDSFSGELRTAGGSTGTPGKGSQGGTLLHKGTLRSGQRITYAGNVVVVGDINPGAEVEASGDIAVMGTLRGVARAGAQGDEGAAVVAFRLEPTQLRIADVIGRSPEEGSPVLEPEVARLKDGMIVIEPLEGTRWEGER